MTTLTKPTWRDIIDGEGDYLAKTKEVVRCVRTEKILPLLEADNIVNNIFVMACAHTFREMPRGDSDAEQLRADFRDSLSRSGQIIFDVHVRSQDDFLASFGGRDAVSVSKN